MANRIDAYFYAMPLKQSSEAPQPKPTAAPQAPKALAVNPAAPADEEDLEQDFIEFFVQKALYPLFRGKQTTNRKVAVFGKKYYWGEDVTHGIESLPKSFRKWCAHNKYTGHNSILVNVYTESSDNIGWHMDDTRELARGEVVSASFAVRKQDRDKNLADMEFRWPNKAIPGMRINKKQPLKHGSVIRFDAVKHKKKKCEHRVFKSPIARVNVTMRQLSGH